MSPESAGHFFEKNGEMQGAIRRCNLQGFPFFIAYAIQENNVFVGSLIHAKSNPDGWPLHRSPGDL